jgi:hypothetical protein
LQVHSSLKSSARKERDKIMMTVNVLLSGRLKLDGYGQDRVILMPPDVAALWRFLGVQNMGMESVCDF